MSDAQASTMSGFLIRQMTTADIPGAVALQRACFPPPFPEELLWNAEHLAAHLQIFPDGQLIAEAGSAVIGSASSLIISEENWQAHRNWDSTVGGPFLKNHEPNGSTMYGVDVSVHLAWRGRGVGRAFYKARFQIASKLGLARYGTACRIPDFSKWLGDHSNSMPDDYGCAVAAGETVDRTLTPLLRYGLDYLGLIRDYMPDEESANAAALLQRRMLAT
jgi:hypothetical protein